MFQWTRSKYLIMQCDKV